MIITSLPEVIVRLFPILILVGDSVGDSIGVKITSTNSFSTTGNRRKVTFGAESSILIFFFEYFRQLSKYLIF